MFSAYLDHLLIELRPFLKELLACVILAFPFLFTLSVLFHLFACFVRFIRNKFIFDRKIKPDWKGES